MMNDMYSTQFCNPQVLLNTNIRQRCTVGLAFKRACVQESQVERGYITRRYILNAFAIRQSKMKSSWFDTPDSGLAHVLESLINGEMRSWA